MRWTLFRMTTGGHWASPYFLHAQDLGRGSLVMAADNRTVLEVIDVVQLPAQSILQLEADGAILKVIASHRVMVPSSDGVGQHSEALAGELRAGDWVICSSGTARQLSRVEALEEQEPVMAITFQPDEAVAAFQLPEAILTRGQVARPKRATRRSGMHRRGRGRTTDQTGGNDQWSIPATAAGEYSD